MESLKQSYWNWNWNALFHVDKFVEKKKKIKLMNA